MAILGQTLIDTLKAARGKSGHSQRAIGKIIGMPQSHISKIESGTVDISLSTLIAYARALDMELIAVPRKSKSLLETLLTSNERQRDKVSGVGHIPHHLLLDEETDND